MNMTTRSDKQQPEVEAAIPWEIVAREDGPENTVELVRGVHVGLPIEARGERDGLVWQIDVDLVDDRLACTRLEVTRKSSGPAITSELVRAVPLARYVHQLAMKNVWQTIESDGDRFDAESTSPPSKTTAELLAEGPTDEALAHVASVYRLAYISGVPPTKAVVDLGLTRPTAQRWLRAARKKGHL